MLPIAVVLLAPRVHPRGASPEDPLDEVSVRLQAARMEFESALAAPAGELDVANASRRFDEALLELRGELESLREHGTVRGPGADGPDADPARAQAPRAQLSGSRRLLLQSSADELDLSWARLREVAHVAAHVRALARLHVEMQTLLDAGRPGAAIQLFEARLPEPLDPLDWPAVVRRRIRDVERLAQTARSAPSRPPGPTPRGEPALGSRPK